MLHITKCLYALPTEKQMTSKHTVKINDNPNGKYLSKRNIKLCILKCGLDGFVVGGIVFCASVPVLGFEDIITNICIAGYASLFTGGLTFFSEMRIAIKKFF